MVCAYFLGDEWFVLVPQKATYSYAQQILNHSFKDVSYVCVKYYTNGGPGR
jgi:hypothetical protein